ncbi:hypothetical protein ECNIH5_00685 [Enterobacter cloacae]|nr:hypothetical protein ECNIH3_00690 [Enterobacter hormaechei subsp. hoffmannii ECNIH3]AIN26221.1 hypothetical protein ECR091_00690 [Enterobacter hormaechei subsp. hoffmannii ECR091]AIX57359.1 hypothetical protein ECNIH5_00685 [Enterobacter cloacae]
MTEPFALHVALKMKHSGCRKQPEWLSTRSLLKLLLSILKLFTKKVSLNKKQLVRLTYKFSKKDNRNTFHYCLPGFLAFG